jgi:hypothetical protein
VLHHIAEGHANSVRWLHGMACGDGVAESAEDIDRANAVHAVRSMDAGRAETVALLESNGALMESTLRGLGDEELDRTAPFGPAGGRELATVDLAAVAARHTREHLAHAVAAAQSACRAARTSSTGWGCSDPGASIRTWCTVPVKGAGGA